MLRKKSQNKKMSPAFKVITGPKKSIELKVEESSFKWRSMVENVSACCLMRIMKKNKTLRLGSGHWELSS